MLKKTNFIVYIFGIHSCISTYDNNTYKCEKIKKNPKISLEYNTL